MYSVQAKSSYFIALIRPFFAKICILSLSSLNHNRNSKLQLFYTLYCIWRWLIARAYLTASVLVNAIIWMLFFFLSYFFFFFVSRGRRSCVSWIIKEADRVRTVLVGKASYVSPPCPSLNWSLLPRSDQLWFNLNQYLCMYHLPSAHLSGFFSRTRTKWIFYYTRAERTPQVAWLTWLQTKSSM